MAEALSPHLVGDRPNSYTFTKSVAEALVASYGITLTPLCPKSRILWYPSHSPLVSVFLWYRSRLMTKYRDSFLQKKTFRLPSCGLPSSDPPGKPRCLDGWATSMVSAAVLCSVCVHHARRVHRHWSHLNSVTVGMMHASCIL